MKKNKIFILLAIIMIIAIIIFFIFFHTNSAKNLKIGNNTSSQEIVDYILNISSYETIVEVEVESNKNKNQYVIKQQYESPDTSSQEVIEPSNIAGVKISRNGNQLKIENTNLSLTSIFENYEYVSDNLLDLNVFIQDYQSYEKASWKEENNQIIMTTKQDKQEKTLWVDRTTGKPIKLEVKWTNKKTKVYILYNEVNINSLK
ncbi:MAG: hypothetical protein HFJ35_03335 [Clostridia bacterium]|nr:hypothetical protein [Clostridia bacterium]